MLSNLAKDEQPYVEDGSGIDQALAHVEQQTQKPAMHSPMPENSVTRADSVFAFMGIFSYE